MNEFTNTVATETEVTAIAEIKPETKNDKSLLAKIADGFIFTVVSLILLCTLIIMLSLPWVK